jgi:predicted Zn-dependent protease
LDADTNALALMAGAGYEPSSLISMLRVLEKNQDGQTGGFSKTHPTPAQRISNANASVGNYAVPDTRGFRQERYKQP